MGVGVQVEDVKVPLPPPVAYETPPEVFHVSVDVARARAEVSGACPHPHPYTHANTYTRTHTQAHTDTASYMRGVCMWADP
jgi:hypothetical protein